MKQQDMVACSFDNWYTIFRKHTAKSSIFNLPDDILEFIKSAPLILPRSLNKIDHKNEDTSDTDEDVWSDDESQSPTRPYFPDFEESVNKGIELLGGYVFPKLNWSAPKDATWITFGNSLKCCCAADILLLLKASDFIEHDIYSPFTLCSDWSQSEDNPLKLVLVLRKWQDYRPNGEFRCFIKSNCLIAICQRIYDTYFKCIETERSNIIEVISNFIEQVIRDKFPLTDYVVDVHLNFNVSSCILKVEIIDFNVFGPPTDGLLYSWEELDSFSHDKEVSFRWQEDESLKSSIFTQYKVPLDLVDISSGIDPNKLMDLVEAHVEEQKRKIME